MASSDQRMERPIGGKRTTPENNDPIWSNVATFVQVNMMLRKTFRQDSVLMMGPANRQSSLIQPAFRLKRQVNVIALSLWNVRDLLCQYTLVFKPRLGDKNFFSACPLVLLLLPLVITFFAYHCHSLYSTTTNERASERMNEWTVAFPF
jgi:hypothetical protein